MLIRVRTAPAGAHPNHDGRQGEPVTFGIPLPKGLVADPSSWVLRQGLDEASARESPARPLQARVLDRWVDGSARWVLVDARIDQPPAGLREAVALFVDTGGRPDGPTGNPVATVSDRQGAISIETGSAHFALGAGSAFPWRSVRTPGGEWIAPAGCRLVVTDAQGAEHVAEWGSPSLESAGALRIVTRLDGTVGAGGGRSLALTARIDHWAGSAAARVRVTLTNPDRAQHPGGFWDLGDAGSVLLKDVSLGSALSGSAERLGCSPESGAPFEDGALPFELYQDSSGGEAWQSTNHLNRERRVPVSFRGYRLRRGGPPVTGLRATPVAHLLTSAGALAIAVPRFWQNFPMAIEADASRLMLRVLPGQFGSLHELQGGEQKTWEYWLSFGSDGVADEPLSWCRNPTIAVADPEWTMATGAVPFLAPLESAHARMAQSAVDGQDRFELKREVIDEYGWRHFGEIYGDHESVRQTSPPIVSHYNNQYDPASGFLQQFLRTGDVRWWTMASELAAHVIDIDIYHTDRDKPAYNRGLFWHTYHYGDADLATHRTYPASAKGATHGGGPSADHNYTTGLMLHFFLTGDEASRQTAIDLGQFVLNLDDGRQTVFRWFDRGPTGHATLSEGPEYQGPGRGPANSLNALVDAFRLSGDARFLTKAEEVIRRVVHPAEDIARHRLDEPEVRWFYTMFLQSLGKYLHAKAEANALDEAYAYGRDALLHYARWMAANEYPYLDKPEKLEFPTETWAAQDIRKSDVFAYAALHASGEERGRFDERARFFHERSVSSLAARPTWTLARPVIILQTSGLLQAWRERHPDAAEPEPAARPSYGRPQVFVSQRVRAIRRAKRVAIGGLVAGVIAALMLVF